MERRSSPCGAGSVERREPLQCEAGTHTVSRTGSRPRGRPGLERARMLAPSLRSVGPIRWKALELRRSRFGGGPLRRETEALGGQSMRRHGAFSGLRARSRRSATVVRGAGAQRAALEPRQRSVRGRLVGSASDHWFLGPIRCDARRAPANKPVRPSPRHGRPKPGDRKIARCLGARESSRGELTRATFARDVRPYDHEHAFLKRTDRKSVV